MLVRTGLLLTLLAASVPTFAQEVPRDAPLDAPSGDVPPEDEAPLEAPDEAPLGAPAVQPAPSPAPATAVPPPRPDEPPATVPVYGRLSEGTEPAEAQPGDWDPWAHPEAFGDGRDHDGFFLRLALGVGWGRVRSTFDGGDAGPRFRGGALGFDVAVGGTLSPGFALHGELFGAVLPAPQVRSRLPSRFDLDVLTNAFGVGVTYYIMPINLYVSAAAGLGAATFERDDGAQSSSYFGLAAQLMVGKEWWVDSDWGLGVAARAMYLGAADPFYDSLRALSASLLFTGTYN